MTDRRVFFAVVAFLGATLLACVVAIAVLAGLDKTVPGILENLGVGSLTGLAGLLARGPASDEPQAVKTVEGDALEVVETPAAAPRRRRRAAPVD